MFHFLWLFSSRFPLGDNWFMQFDGCVCVCMGILLRLFHNYNTNQAHFFGFLCLFLAFCQLWDISNTRNNSLTKNKSVTGHQNPYSALSPHATCPNPQIFPKYKINHYNWWIWIVLFCCLLIRQLHSIFINVGASTNETCRRTNSQQPTNNGIKTNDNCFGLSPWFCRAKWNIGYKLQQEKPNTRGKPIKPHIGSPWAVLSTNRCEINNIPTNNKKEIINLVQHRPVVSNV